MEKLPDDFIQKVKSLMESKGDKKISWEDATEEAERLYEIGKFLIYHIKK